MSKKQRHNDIIKLIEEREIETQEMLTEALIELGYKVSQSTVSRDINELNLLKVEGENKKSYYTYEQRKIILEACRYVDLVVPEYNWEQKIDDVQKYQADIFVMGDDWKGKFDFLKDYCEVIYLPRTPDVSSTQTKEYLIK